MQRTFRSLLAAFAGVLTFGLGLAVSSEARADVTITQHIDLDLQPDPSGLYYAATPAVKIVDPSRMTVSFVQDNVVHARVVGLNFVQVGAVRRPVVYWGRHRHYRPIVYHVAAPRWIVRPQAVYVAPRRVYVPYYRRARPVVVARPGVVVARPGGVVVAPPGKVVVRGPGVVVAPGGGGRPHRR
jgi:hypothetical protein